MMKKQIAVSAFLLALLLLPMITNAQLCNDLYNTLQPNMANKNAANLAYSSTYEGMLSIASIIILAVLSVMAMAYAIGYSMRIDSITNYVKREFAEQVANIIIIAAIVGMTALTFNGIVFITSIATFGMSGLGQSSAVSSLMISGFVGAMIGSYAFALIGIAIAFLIAYDSLEAFAQLLGAPAFRGRAGSIFQKMI